MAARDRLDASSGRPPRPVTEPGRPEDWVAGADVDLGATLGWPGRLTGKVVGQGRRGATVRARQDDGTEVAVKVGPPLRNDRARRRHAEDTARLRALEPGRRLLPVLAGGVGPGGHPWQVTPWVAGGSLADRLVQGPLNAGEVADVAAGVGLGLDDLHRQGVLHANLRPGNLLVGDDGSVVLTGMAVSGDPDPAGPSAPPALAGPDPAGRLAHLPPEVLEGRSWTAAGDLWALGSCLHTLVSGRPPWAREAEGGAAAAVLGMATARPPGMRPAATPAWLSKLIDGCLAVDEARRPADGATVAAMAAQRVDDRVDTLLPPSPQVEGRPLGSSYLLDETLGSGSSGLVWRGHQRGDGRPVAVKVLRPELADDPDAVARFLRERTTLVRLDHPNLVPVLDLVAEGQTLAIVMELVEGQDLRKVLRSGPLDAGDACRLLAQTAAGVAAVHRAGIVHRDLKPENILVEGAGPSRRARVTDFGIARAATGTSVTRPDQLIGTAEYLAPELVAGRPVDTASDVYSLGVLAYEVLSGRRPFQADHPAALLRAHLDQDPAPLSGLPPGAWELLSAALAKDPAARPDAAALADRLERLAPQLQGAHIQPADPPADSPAGGSPLPTADTAANLRRARPAPAAAPDPHLPAGDEDRRPAPATTTASAARPTEQWSSWRSRPAAPSATEEAPARSHRGRFLLAGVIAVAVLGVGAGVAYALTRSPPVEHAPDVTASVAAVGPGTVRITWRGVAARPHFATYVLSEDGVAVSQPPLPSTSSMDLNQVSPGYHCYRVFAAFDGPVPAGLSPHLSGSKECVNVP